MPTKREIQHALGLPPNTKTRQVYNHAIRACVPGGNNLLERLRKMDDLRTQFPNNPQFADEVGKLIDERERLTDDLLAGRIPLVRLQ